MKKQKLRKLLEKRKESKNVKKQKKIIATKEKKGEQ